MTICILPPAPSKMFLMYTNFPSFRTSFIAISLTPSARTSKTCETKCIIFGEALRIRVKKFKQNLSENHLKSTKITITACKFSKIFRGSMSPNPLEPFLCLNELQISSAEKNTLEKSAPPFKISRSPLRKDESDCCSLGPH